MEPGDDEVFLKKTLLIAIILFSILLLFSCAFPDVQRYDDFLMDLDVYNRLDIAFYEVQREDASLYTKADLGTLVEDLNTLGLTGEEVKDINVFFKEAAGYLTNGIAAYESGQDALYEELLEDATYSYEHAKVLLNELRGGEKHD